MQSPFKPVAKSRGCEADPQDFVEQSKFHFQNAIVVLEWASYDVQKNQDYKQSLIKDVCNYDLSLFEKAEGNQPNRAALYFSGSLPQIFSFLRNFYLQQTKSSPESYALIEFQEEAILSSLRQGDNFQQNFTCPCVSGGSCNSISSTAECSNPLCAPGGELSLIVLPDPSFSSKPNNSEAREAESALLCAAQGCSTEAGVSTWDTFTGTQLLGEKAAGEGFSTKSKIASVDKPRLPYLSENLLSQLDHSAANIRLNQGLNGPEFGSSWPANMVDWNNQVDNMLRPSEEFISSWVDQLLSSDDENQKQATPLAMENMPQDWVAYQTGFEPYFSQTELPATLAAERAEDKEGPSDLPLEEGPGLIVPEISFPRRYNSIDEVAPEALISIREEFFDYSQVGFDSKYCLLQFGVQKNTWGIQELSNLFSNYGDIEHIVYNQYLGVYLYVYNSHVGAEMAEKYLRPLNLMGINFGLLRGPTEVDIASVFFPPKVSGRFTKYQTYTPKRRFSVNSGGVPVRPNRIGKCLHITWAGTDKSKGSIMDLVVEAVSQIAVINQTQADTGPGKRNMWFAEFETIEDAVRALMKCHNMKVGSGQLRCSFTKNLQ